MPRSMVSSDQCIETIKMAFHKTASRYVRSMTTTHYRLNPALISLNPFVLWIEISPNKGIDLTLECVTRTQIGTKCNCFLMQCILHTQTSSELELTANSLGALIETHSRLILRTLSYVTVNSQDDSQLWTCYELSASLQLTSGA